MIHDLPETRGRLTPGKLLSELTWLRVGGAADVLFQPADVEDLCTFLGGLNVEVPVFPMGVGSNLIVRDGGLRAVVIRLGRGFNAIEVEGTLVTAGAAALDAHVARRAAETGVDLTFLRTIPGSVGGAVRMNAGCYGSYVADVFVEATAVTREGALVTVTAQDLDFAADPTARGLGDCRGDIRGSAGRSGRAGGQDGGSAGPPRCQPADQRPHRGQHFPQSGGVFQHGARR